MRCSLTRIDRSCLPRTASAYYKYCRGLPGTEIHCQVVDYTIPEGPIAGLFEALSYVWGDPTKKFRTYVSDLPSHVEPATAQGYPDTTENLFTALQQLRDPALPRSTSIDAVCINQDDLMERANQVKFMARIYSHVNRLVVWLGTEENESAELFALIEDVANIIWRSPPDPLPSAINLIEYFQTLLRVPHWRRSWTDVTFTNQRDKVFAMLGMCSPETLNVIAPDYTKPRETI
ncbi:hypothetical protein BU25DRAFT_340828 [Macroventuria anomochaeta]|uniref:Uncharacterized protein n=1 Tax=Macroventuria anomochaeta TaxID=301207 RepID=A0ACB6S3S3_9PLEO|nr:uncharacterized protein BU25DRAFT_340828 [Macroventuria anomochaeta]KAF2628013.1 hypothetical protein BU25DRAFT_340828 [Macroventuria anomochaeta]